MKKLILFLLVGGFALMGYLGCKKTGLDPTTLNNSFIEEARRNFILQNRQETIIANGGELNERQKINKTPIWDKAFILQLSIGESVIVPLKFDKIIYGKSNFGDSSEISVEQLSKLFIYKDAQNKFHCEIITSLPDHDYLYAKSKAFTGIVLAEDLQGNFLRQYKCSDKMILRYNNTRQNTSPGSVSQSLMVVAVTTCEYVDWYKCVNGEDGNLSDCEYRFTENKGCSTNYYDDGNDQPDNPTKPDYQAAGGVGTAPGSLQKVRNLIKNPCLGGIVNNMINNKINITFVDIPAYDKDGKTIESIDPATGAITETIYINQNFLIGASQEYDASVIIHEIIHAVLNATNVKIIDSQHAYMLQNYMDAMSLALMDFFPGLTQEAARSMSLQGLGDITDSAAFDTVLANYKFNKIENSSDNFSFYSQQYQYGTVGTPCGGAAN